MGHMSCVVAGHEGLLLQPLADVFDWVASPHLSLLYYSAGRNHAVGRNDASLFEDGAFQNDRVVPHIDSSFDGAGVERAVVLYDGIPHHDEPGAEPRRRVSSSVQDAVVANADILTEPSFCESYVMLFISPRMTVPCQMAISVPIHTSPTMVALGATKLNPTLRTFRS